eukprot:4296548-Karenia_brevis.AAC.1
MAEEAVAQAMKSVSWCISFGLVCRAVEFLCPVPRERMANASGGASIRSPGCVPANDDAILAQKPVKHAL